MDTRSVIACVLISAWATTWAATARAGVINVPGDQPTIQAGVDAAKTGDEVVVAQGAYVENVNITTPGITVRSTVPSDPAVVVATIIDGGGVGRAVRIGAADTTVRGFAITGAGAVIASTLR